MANPCHTHKLLLSRFSKKFENKDVFLPVGQSELVALLPRGFLRRKIISGQTLKMETVSLQRAFRAGSEDEGLLPRLQSLGEHGPRPGLAVLRDRRRRATDTRGDPSAEPWADTGVDGR